MLKFALWNMGLFFIPLPLGINVLGENACFGGFLFFWM